IAAVRALRNAMAVAHRRSVSGVAEMKPTSWLLDRSPPRYPWTCHAARVDQTALHNADVSASDHGCARRPNRPRRIPVPLRQGVLVASIMAVDTHSAGTSRGADQFPRQQLSMAVTKPSTQAFPIETTPDVHQNQTRGDLTGPDRVRMKGRDSPDIPPGARSRTR